MEALKLNVFYRRHGSMKIERDKTPKPKIKDLKDLNKIANPVEDAKTIHFKVLDFLKVLHGQTKDLSAPGKLSITELRNGFHVSAEIVKLLFQHGMIKETSGTRKLSQYKWDTIPPNMQMAIKLVSDAKVMREAPLIAVHEPEKEIYHENRLVELLTPHMPTVDYNQIALLIKEHAPPQIDLSPLIDIMQKSIQSHVQKMHLNNLTWMQNNIGNIVAEQVKVAIAAHVPVEVHHHHTIEESKSLFGNLFKTKTI